MMRSWGDVPPCGEGVEAGQALRPHQEPGWRWADGRVGSTAGWEKRAFSIGASSSGSTPLPERQQCFP